jgi:signal transduction histidine kinase
MQRVNVFRSHPPGDGTHPLQQALTAFSAMLAAACEVDDLRAALHGGLALLAGADEGRHHAICEISVAPDGRPLIAWRTGDGFEIAEDRMFADWFRRAKSSPGFFESARGGAWHGLVHAGAAAAGWESYAGLFIDGPEPDDIRRATYAAVAALASSAFIRIERGISDNIIRQRLAATGEESLAWLGFGTDIVWEATAEGVIRCRRVLNRRSDIARAIEGANLRKLAVGAGGRNLFDMLQAEGHVRHLRAQFAEGPAAHLSAENAFYVSGMLREAEAGGPPSFIGSLTCTSARTAVPFVGEEASALSQMRAARRREERHRIEDDAMLEGLRLLLDARTPRDKLAKLTALLRDNMEGEEALIVEPGYDGRPRILLPEPRTLDIAAGRIVDDIAAGVAATQWKLYTEEDPASGRIRDALGIEGGSIAAFALPLRVQTAYLLCATAAPQGLSLVGISFAERFAFILRQALLLREEQAQLAQTAKMAALGQMSASIAHELKQPLNTISLATQNLEALLSSPKFDPAAVEAKIARVLAQVDRAANVIDRMRRFGRKSMGESVTVSVADLVEGVLLMIRHVLERAGVEVELALPPGLALKADELQLEQVLTNLIQNAADAIAGIGSPQAEESGRRSGKIRIAAFPSPDEPGAVMLRIEDNGPGFPPSVMERALEPFFTTKPAEQGTGLGLAICDAIVRESGGRLMLGNHAGGGFVALVMPAAAPER